MTIHYLDPSAWIKRHFQESGSETVNSLFRKPIDAACCRLGLLEMIATTSRKSFHAALPSAVLEVIVGNINADFAAFRAVIVDEPCIAKAIDLMLKYRLRTMDAIHLASAIMIGRPADIIMVSSDIELLTASKSEGLGILNPAVLTN